MVAGEKRWVDEVSQFSSEGPAIGLPGGWDEAKALGEEGCERDGMGGSVKFFHCRSFCRSAWGHKAKAGQSMFCNRSACERDEKTG